MSKLTLAVDLGGTNLRTAVVNQEGKIIERSRTETPQKSAENIIDAIVSASKKHIENNSCSHHIESISVAVPGTLNVDEGLIINSPNLSALNGCYISKAIEKKLKIPCVLNNDANAAALGEKWLGASKGFENSIMVTLGTGVGGGIIIDGKILRGVDGTAAEIGHICVEPKGVKCGCGSFGCVEQYSSANAIVRMTKELMVDYPESNLSSAQDLTSHNIYQEAKNGDKLALEVFRRQGFYLGIVLAGLINVLNPEAIVIGGGASDGWDLFVPQMIEQIKLRAYEEPARRVKIIRAECGGDAGILGAAFLAFQSV